MGNCCSSSEPIIVKQEEIHTTTDIIIKKKRKRTKNLTKTVAGKKKDKNMELKNFHFLLYSSIVQTDRPILEKILRSHFYMKNLDFSTRCEIINEMSLVTVEANVTLYNIGSIGYYFYIIKEGEAELFFSINHKVRKKEWEYFGEVALLHETERLASAKTLKKTTFYILERHNFKKIIEKINFKLYEQNKKFIESVPVLSVIDPTEKSILCQKIIQSKFIEGEYIVKEGEFSNKLFIIKSGEVNCVNKDKVFRTLKEGDYFGERGLLIQNEKRSYDVIASTEVICYSVSITTLKEMLGEEFRTKLVLNIIKAAFKKSKKFCDIYHKIFEEVFDCFKTRFLHKNELAYEKGTDVSEKIVIIIDGALVYSKNTNEILVKRGEVLFEEEIYGRRSFILNDDIIAIPDCYLIEAKVSEIFDILKVDTFDNLLTQSSLYEELKKINIFSPLNYEKLMTISKKINLKHYKPGEKIIENVEGQKFFIIKEGTIDLLQGEKFIRSISKNNFFGEKSLLVEQDEDLIAVAKTDVQVYVLEKIDFLFSVQEDFREFLINRLMLLDINIELSDLNFVCKLGAGSFGQVSLVKNKKTDFIYSIKAISIEQIISNHLTETLLLEKKILLSIDHPFIVKLVKSLKDRKYIYLIEEFIKGKELYEVFTENDDEFTTEQAQFYSASMLIAINYLHQNKIIYRDFKMENIMVCENGYIKIVDFGTAKILNDEDRTTTIIGTPHYMAPELIMGEGYSFQIDYWSIAVCIYEFITGKYPFGEEDDNPRQIYDSILNDRLQFPSEVEADVNFKLLMIEMLNKSPLTRLNKFEQIKKHNWFKEFNWEALENLSLKPDITLKVNSKVDKKYGGMPYADYSKDIMKENSFEKRSKEEGFIFEDWIVNF